MSTLDRFGVPYPMAAKSMMIQPKAKYKFRVLWDGPAGYALGVNVDSIELPSITFDHHNVHKFNTESGYLGKKRVSDFTVTIRDDVKSQVLTSVTTTILDNYNRFQRVLSGSSPDLYDYKFQMWVQFLSGKEITTGDAAAIAQNIDAGLSLADSLLGTDLGKNSEEFQGTLATMVIEGCCVTSMSPGTLDYSDSNFNTIQLTIKPDNAYWLNAAGDAIGETLTTLTGLSATIGLL